MLTLWSQLSTHIPSNFDAVTVEARERGERVERAHLSESALLVAPVGVYLHSNAWFINYNSNTCDLDCSSVCILFALDGICN